MPPRVDVTVRTVGEQKLARLGRALKDAGDKDLQRELRRAMQRGGKPLKDAARKGALERLPKRGGLAERVATSKFGVRTSTTGRGASVRVIGRSGYDLQGMDEGEIRHPVFGDPHVRVLAGRREWKWVSQPVKPGWFSDAEEAAAPKVRDELVKAIDIVAAKLEASG
jgi:hypothetical protein